MQGQPGMYPQQGYGYPPQQGGYPPQQPQGAYPQGAGAYPPQQMYGGAPSGMGGMGVAPRPMMGGPGLAHGSGAGTLRVQLAANKLRNKDVGGKSDPYFTIHRADGNGKAIGPLIHKSDVVNNNLSPVWQPFTTSVRKFCNGDYHQRLRIDILDHDIGGKADSLGYTTVTLRELMDAFPAGRKFPVTGAKKMGLKSSKSAGDIIIKDFALWQENLPH